MLAHELYGKGTDFDGGTDPVVRVDARLLRDKLREYYEGRSDPVVISLPKGTYVPVFHANAVSPIHTVPVAPWESQGAAIRGRGRARSAAAQATAINPDLAEAHTALGWIAFYHDWNWVESEERFRRALQINPADFSAHVGLAHLLSNTGRHEAALRQIDQALAVEPTSPLAGALKAQFLFYARRYDEAREQSSALIGYTHGIAGRRAEATGVLRALMNASRQSYVPPYHIALVHHGIGEDAETLRWLERGYAERDVRMVFIGVDPLWDSLRQNRPFAVLLKSMNFAQ